MGVEIWPFVSLGFMNFVAFYTRDLDCAVALASAAAFDRRGRQRRISV
jgi:hypothetical protein